MIFESTHSVKQPGGQGESSGGQCEFVEYLARAAVAVGVAGVFIETHQDPDNAPSDGPNMIKLSELDNIVKRLKYIHEANNPPTTPWVQAQIDYSTILIFKAYNTGTFLQNNLGGTGNCSRTAFHFSSTFLHFYMPSSHTDLKKGKLSSCLQNYSLIGFTCVVN